MQQQNCCAAGNKSIAIFLDNAGDVWAKGSLGHVNGSNVSHDHPTKIVEGRNIISVTCGGTFLILLDSDGFLWAMGRNHEKQFGMVSKQKETKTAVRVPGKKSPAEFAAVGFFLLCVSIHKDSFGPVVIM